MSPEAGRVLVAGATGLVGANLVRALLARGARVRGTWHAKPPVIADPRVEYVQCDLTRREDCRRAVTGIDHAYLCAADTSGAKVMATNPVAHVTENLRINSLMLESACLEGVRKFLFMSSTTVYPPVAHPVREEEAFDGNPHESYFGVGWMKRYVEKLAEFYHRRYGMSAILIRATNLYGPYDKFDPERSHVLPALIRRAEARENPFVVWGDGSAVRDFLYVEDAVGAMVTAMERCEGLFPVNLGSGRTVTIRQAAELIQALTGHSGAEIRCDISQPTTIPIRLVDLSRARSVLGFEAKLSLEEGLRRTIEWYRANR